MGRQRDVDDGHARVLAEREARRACEARRSRGYSRPRPGPPGRSRLPVPAREPRGRRAGGARPPRRRPGRSRRRSGRTGAGPSDTIGRPERKSRPAGISFGRAHRIAYGPGTHPARHRDPAEARPRVRELTCGGSGHAFQSILPPVSNHYAESAEDFERRLERLDDADLRWLVDRILDGSESLGCIQEEDIEAFVQRVRSNISDETGRPCSPTTSPRTPARPDPVTGAGDRGLRPGTGRGDGMRVSLPGLDESGSAPWQFRSRFDRPETETDSSQTPQTHPRTGARPPGEAIAPRSRISARASSRSPRAARGASRTTRSLRFSPRATDGESRSRSCAPRRTGGISRNWSSASTISGSPTRAARSTRRSSGRSTSTSSSARSGGTSTTRRATTIPTRRWWSKTRSSSGARRATSITRSGSAGSGSSSSRPRSRRSTSRTTSRPRSRSGRYAWNAKLPLNILTDFEEWAIYDCTKKPAAGDTAGDGPDRVLHVPGPARRSGTTSSRSSRRSASCRGRSTDSSPRRRVRGGRSASTRTFLALIEEWRDLLAKNIALRNPALSVDDLNIAVQRIIDRIIFLRICEDRGMEPYGRRCRGSSRATESTTGSCDLFQRADDRYNSGLFHFSNEPGWDEMPDASRRAFTSTTRC